MSICVLPNLETAGKTGNSSHSGLLDGPLRTLVRRPPLVVDPSASVYDTLALMDRARGDAVVVADPETQLPLGIVTLSDVVHRIALGGLEVDEPVVGMMTGAPLSLPADAPAHRATVLMTKRYLRHLVLVEPDGRLCNVLSQADLFGLRGGGADLLAETVASAKEVGTMVKAADAIRRRGAELFAGGMGAEALGYWMSGLNDLVGMRIIELIEDEFDLPPVPWCWMVFGSEGRLEQSFATDQDNGLVFQPGDEGSTEAVRQVLLPFARAVNQALDACGFERCKGEIMAGNPAWCLSLTEWKQRYETWMRVPEPEAVLNSTIFFDFRPLYGRYELVDNLRTWLSPRVPGHDRFLRALAEQALTCEPPLGWMGRFRYDGDKDFPHTLDLKLYGLRPFVDAARVWGLANGIWATNTGQRLRATAEALDRPPSDMAAAVEAFYLVQRFRIQQQLTNKDPDRVNRLDPNTLNQLNRLMLKEAFKEAKALQERLRLDYGL